ALSLRWTRWSTALHPALYGWHPTRLTPIATARAHKTEVGQTTKITKPSTSLVMNQSFHPRSTPTGCYERLSVSPGPAASCSLRIPTYYACLDAYTFYCPTILEVDTRS
ncbi:unnamed protein product, partial [Ectocarpus sp. 8 AP-2014]